MLCFCLCRCCSDRDLTAAAKNLNMKSFSYIQGNCECVLKQKGPQRRIVCLFANMSEPMEPSSRQTVHIASYKALQLSLQLMYEQLGSVFFAQKHLMKVPKHASLGAAAQNQYSEFYFLLKC